MRTLKPTACIAQRLNKAADTNEEKKVDRAGCITADAKCKDSITVGNDAAQTKKVKESRRSEGKCSQNEKAK